MFLKTALAVVLVFLFSEMVQGTSSSVLLASHEATVQPQTSELSASLHEATATSLISQIHFIAEFEEVSSHTSQEIVNTAVKRKAAWNSLAMVFSNGFQMLKSNWIASYIRYCALKIPL